MLPVSTKLQDALKNEVQLRAYPKVVAEWNHNRYAKIEKVDAVPTEEQEDQELDSFPISSIIEPNRPARGIIKGRTAPVNLDWRTDPRGEEGFVVPSYSDRPEDQRYYTTSADSIYKYWSSTLPTSNTASGGGYPFTQAQDVFVTYVNPMMTNKVVVGFESSWAKPVNFTVYVRNGTSTTWTVAASNPTVDEKGQVTLYRQSASWGSTVNRDNPVAISGVRIVVNHLDRPDSFLNIIEISARLERDLSEYIASYNSSFSMSETDFITPLGVCSSNTGEITFDNTESVFNFDNSESLYYGLIEKNVKFTMDLEYVFSDATTERVRQFVMYSDEWTGPGSEDISVTLKDYSKYMQEQEVPEQLLEKITVGEAVWRMCDAIGFVDYNYEHEDFDPATNLQYFFTDGERTVWEVFADIAKKTQTAIYFDQNGILQIKTRDSAYSKYNYAVWDFQATNDNGKLADIVEATNEYTFEANSVNVAYKTTKISEDQNGWPKMEVVWEPEDTLVLRASNLTGHLNKENEDFFQMSATDAETWPYEGMVTVGGELIKYDAKRYAYYDKTGRIQRPWVYSQEEKDTIDKTLSSETQRYKNAFDGLFKIKERGAYWTEPLDHFVSIPNFSSKHFWYNSPGTTSWGINGGVYHDVKTGVMTLATNHEFVGNRILTATVGAEGYNGAYSHYGTRMRIPKKNGPTGGGGLVFFGSDGGAGYYVELMKTDIFDVPGGPQRPVHGNEMSFFVRRDDGTFTRPAGSVPMVIAADVWYDIDVFFNGTRPSVGGDFIHDITIFINGLKAMEFGLELGRVNRSGNFGVWVRGNNSIDFEYLYAHDKMVEVNTDDFSNYDRIRGGYASTAWERNFVFGENMNNFLLYGKATAPAQAANTKYFFEEFGPIVHEVREMDVSFEKDPVMHSRFFCTNESQIVLPYYVGTPYGAKFMIANASRTNAVAKGEDLLMFGAENSVNQQTFIYGRLVYQEDEEVHNVKNDDAIRRHGKVEVSFDSEWIQNKQEAEALGNWILAHWALGADQISMTVFGNPALELGDLVTVDYPRMNMSTDTHRYFVSEFSQNFDNGLETSLTLRRSKI